VPLVLQSCGTNGDSYEESTLTQDASKAGLAFVSYQVLTPGQVLQLAVGLPSELREHDHGLRSYYVRVEVRNVLALGAGRSRVGVVFLGPSSAERRRHPRSEVFATYVVQQADEWGAVVTEQVAVAENVSPGGARLLTTLSCREGDVVSLRERHGSFEGRARVVTTRLEHDNIRRLHLAFLDTGDNARPRDR
jgi:hypothetical protein